nr:protein SRG1-like [Ipomoea batatas]
MEKNISPKLGNSLPVPCVQELAKESPEIIPPRYVREDLEPPAPAVKEIPVINLANLLKGDNEELKKMDIASKEWGFFQLINHGVSSSLVEKVKTDTKDFFHLPMEEKKKFWQEPGDLQGFGHAFVISEEQKLDWSDMFYIMTLPTYLRKSDLFPNLPLPFRETVEMYAEELRNLAMKIIEYLAKALGIEREHIRGLFEGGMQAMRMNHYPRCPQPDKVIGLCPHSDAVGLTILLQLNEKEGLQIRKNGMWIPVKPLPDAFVVNIGDILEILSNGIYRSIEHRAVVNSEEERLSIATFFNPRLDAELGPAPTLITPQNPAQFRTVGVEDYFKGLFARKLDGKAYIDQGNSRDNNVNNVDPSEEEFHEAEKIIHVAMDGLLDQIATRVLDERSEGRTRNNENIGQSTRLGRMENVECFGQINIVDQRIKVPRRPILCNMKLDQAKSKLNPNAKMFEFGGNNGSARTTWEFCHSKEDRTSDQLQLLKTSSTSLLGSRELDGLLSPRISSQLHPVE